MAPAELLLQRFKIEGLHTCLETVSAVRVAGKIVAC